MRPTTLAIVLALTAASSGCIAAAGAGAGVLVTHEFMNDTPHVAHVQFDVDQVWPTTIDTIRELGATEVQVQNYPRLLEADVYGGRVYLQVEAFDLDHTVVRVSFRKHRLLDHRTAEEILQRLMTRYADRA